MRALITGGAGFAGSHLTEYLLEEGHEVTLVTRPRGALQRVEHLLRQIRIERADIQDATRLCQILDEIRPQQIYHLAASSSLVESARNPRRFYDVNFGGTLNLLEAWRKIGFEARMLVVSSSNVYGVAAGAELPFQETSPLRAENPYAGSKIAAEFLAIQFGVNYGLPSVRVRPFQHTGPRQSPAFVCSGLARQVAEIVCGLRRPVLEVGNPEISRDFTDVRDVVRGYALLIDKGRPGEVYQLCSGRALSVSAIIQRLTADVPARIEVHIDATRARAGESPVLWGDPAKTASETGWVPRFGLEETLADLLSYWKGNIR